jgi:hypothetical protein
MTVVQSRFFVCPVVWNLVEEQRKLTPIRDAPAAPLPEEGQRHATEGN